MPLTMTVLIAFLTSPLLVSLGVGDGVCLGGWWLHTYVPT